MASHNLQVERPAPMAIPSGYLQAAIVALLVAIWVATLAAGWWQFSVVCLAVFALPFLLQEPRAAIWYSTVFMLLAMALLPESSRDVGEGTPPEFYYWAAGLFIVTLPLATHFAGGVWSWALRTRGSHKLPAPLLAFLLVSAAAALQGLRLGFEFGYVIRQLYGVLLFWIYFAAVLEYTRHQAEIFTFLKRIKWVALAVGIYTILRYHDRIGEIGFFKQNLSIYLAALACYCLGEFLCAKEIRMRLAWGLQVLVFIVHPILFLSRGAVGLFGITALIAIGMLLPSRKAKSTAVLGAFAVLVLGVLLNLFAPLGEFLSRHEATQRLVPEEALLDPSALGRIEQVFSAIQVVREHPILGLGLGSQLTFYHPGLGYLQSQALVDEGHAYLLSKFGLLGSVCFIWLVASIARSSGWPSRQGLHLGLWLVFIFHLLYMIDGPVMFHFLYTPWVGITCGFLYRMRGLSTSASPRDYCPIQQEGFA